MTQLSLSEVEALAAKASRGAGLSWGLAEEAGKAARWLCLHGHPGLTILHGYLAARHSGLSVGGPAMAGGDWTPQGATALCPLLTGTAFCDFGLMSGVADGGLVLHGVASPALLLPFLDTFGQITGVMIGCDLAGPNLPTQADVAIFRTDAIPTQYRRDTATPDTVISALEAMAMNTTVPASDASRRGAGSATPDSD
jgi:hypothetical protein